MHLHHIIVATDHSAPGHSAVRIGLSLAAKTSARLTIMRVVRGESESSALERLQQDLLAGIASGPAVQVELAIATGLPGIEITRFAEQRGVDLLVLGRKHRSTVARLLVGDTGDAVIRRSRIPCLFVEEGCRALNRLLVALDGSERGMRVFGTARDFADGAGATLSVVTVDEPGVVSLPEPVLPLPLTRSSRLWRELGPGSSRGTACASTETAVSIRQGRVVPEVLDEIAGSRADVLAFGCHRGGPSGLLDGSDTARHLAHTAPVSVLTIPL